MCAVLLTLAAAPPVCCAAAHIENVSATVIAHSMTARTFGVVGIDWVNAPGESIIDSYRSSDGAYNCASRRYNGNVASNGDIALSGSSQIFGDAAPGGIERHVHTVVGGFGDEAGVGGEVEPAHGREAEGEVALQIILVEGDL